MFGQTYYHGTMRKYIILFAKLFSDIIITREDANNNITASIQVPITFGPKDKMIEIINQDPDKTKEAAIVLPIMSYNYGPVRYRQDNKLNTLRKHVRKNANNASNFYYVYNPVPVDIDFSLYVYVKNAEDGTKIVEQIIPYFRPDWTAKVELIPEAGISQNISIVLNNCDHEDHYDSVNITQRRALIWVLNFTLNGYLFGPEMSGPIIKFANTRYFVGEPNNDPNVLSATIVSPGMLANGEPTTNTELSIDPKSIFVDDDWDYAVRNTGLIFTE
jgi:hypothetical protein